MAYIRTYTCHHTRTNPTWSRSYLQATRLYHLTGIITYSKDTLNDTLCRPIHTHIKTPKLYFNTHHPVRASCLSNQCPCITLTSGNLTAHSKQVGQTQSSGKTGAAHIKAGLKRG